MVLFVLYMNGKFRGLSDKIFILIDDVAIWQAIQSLSDVQSLHKTIGFLLNQTQGTLSRLNTNKYFDIHPQQIVATTIMIISAL